MVADYIYTDDWVMATSGERQRYRKTEQFKKFIDDEYAKFINNKDQMMNKVDFVLIFALFFLIIFSGE